LPFPFAVLCGGDIVHGEILCRLRWWRAAVAAEHVHEHMVGLLISGLVPTRYW
jgi:hypothetical protein